MVENLIAKAEEKLKEQFGRIDDIALHNQKKVLDAFIDLKISSQCFSGSTGYGHGDIGRETLAKLYAKVFGGENAIISPLITCGTHAISTVLYGLLRNGDVMLSVTGLPYDTIYDTIFGKNNGSLEEFGVKYKQIDLINGGELDFDRICQAVKELKPKMVYLQRSRGYSDRKAISPFEMKPLFDEIKKISPDSFIVVDNCYGEFVDKVEPTDVGADVIMGSLIKNPGGGIAPTGGYIVGSDKAVDMISTRFTNPSIKLDIGSYELGYRLYYQGLFLSPHVVAQALKGSLLVGQVMEDKGYQIVPANDEQPQDIIKSIIFDTKEELIKFVQLVQTVSPVDGYVLPMPWEMPGYKDEVIMAAGTFVGGASIELSCDSPIRAPYIAYFQGGLTYEHIKIFAEKLANDNAFKG